MKNELDRRFVNGSSEVLEIGAHPHRLLDTWIILYSIGQVLLLLLLGTMLFAKGRRWGKRPTLLNLLLASFLGTIPPCILYYAGQAANPNPATGLCLVQATLKHGSGPMTQVALFALVLDLLLVTRASIKLHLHRRVYTLSMITLLASPYIAFSAWSIPVIFLGLSDPTKIYRIEASFYCTLNDNLYGNINTLFGVAVIVATIGCECYVIRILRRAWREVRELRESREVDISLIIRVGVVTVMEIFFIFVTLIVTGINDSTVAGDVSTVFDALVPIGLFMGFGIRPDILRVWMFWKARSSARDTDMSSSDLDHPKEFVRPEDMTVSDLSLP